MAGLTVAVPSLIWPHRGETPNLSVCPTLQKLLGGRKKAQPLSRSAFYGRYLWQQPFLQAAVKDLGLPENGHYYVCSPLYTDAGMHRVQVTAGRFLGLSAEEADACCAFLTVESVPDELAFYAYKPSVWVMQAQKPLKFAVPSVLDLHGSIGGTDKPEGPDSALLLKYQTQLQMLLYAYAGNRARERAGLPLVNGVWIEPGISAGTPSDAEVFSDSIWQPTPFRQPLPAVLHEAAAGKEAILFLDNLAGFADTGDLFAFSEVLQQMEREWFAPLLAAVRQGTVFELALVTDGAEGAAYRTRSPWHVCFFHKKGSAQ